ncbi:DUF2336 domain-containing protein [Sphingomonas sp. 1P06PA]|uniref:DUF2336 domain-containing protein n=1 Tax=Sphingomonas sp. 1P06PA TaxID=554121 RepID=UPI0039A4F223
MNDDPWMGAPAGASRLLADAARAEALARARVAAAAGDIANRFDARPTDYQRATMARLLDMIVGDIEAALRARLPALLADVASPEALAAIEVARVPLARPLLDRARMLADAEFAALLLSRADEHARVTALALARAEASAADPQLFAMPRFDGLLASADTALAAAARAVAEGEARRLDRFQDAAAGRLDLPAELHHRLSWRVAAALRYYLVGAQALPAAAVDRAVSAAAASAMADYDEGETLEGRAMALVIALRLRGLLDDDMLASLALEGHVAVTMAALSARAGIAIDLVREIAGDADGARLLLLLAASGVSRDAAAALLLALEPADGIGMAERRMADFDRTTPEFAADAVANWRLDPEYRHALADLAAGLGQGDRIA